MARVESAIENALTLLRPGQIGIATVFDGNKFVQCRKAFEHDILCEAAGTLLQPSLTPILTVDRALRLAALGWTIDPHFGNYVRVVPTSTGVKSLARHVLRVLGEGYGADLEQVEVSTDWVRDTKCPPRSGPRQNLAGSINDATSMAAVALRGCRYARPASPVASVVDLLGAYGLRLTGEIERLVVNIGAPHVHFVLNTKTGYVQCAPWGLTALYCEAASAGSVPALGKVLTPDRIALLHGLGFADPGRTPNFARITPIERTDAGRLAADLLTILHDVYGYQGQSNLEIATERRG